jgi:hypothetical protein
LGPMRLCERMRVEECRGLMGNGGIVKKKEEERRTKD